MKIEQIFFCGDSQMEIFFLCRDYARVRRNKEVEFYSRARIEETFSKIDRNKNIILIISFAKYQNLADESLLKRVKEINPKNIIFGIDRIGGAEYFSSCDIVLKPNEVLFGLNSREALLKEKGFEPDVIPLAMFFSRNIQRYSRKEIILFFEERKWQKGIDGFIKRA